MQEEESNSGKGRESTKEPILTTLQILNQAIGQEILGAKKLLDPQEHIPIG
jgi:hypothetical protein